MFRKLIEIWTLKPGKNHTSDYKGESSYSRDLLKAWKGNWDNLIKGFITNRKEEWFNDEGEYISAWKPLGRLPRWTRQSELNTLKFSKKINRYLEYQELRIIKAVDKKQYSKATIIWLILLKNSFAYQLTLFNKVMPQWHYMLSKIEARNLLQKVVNKCRSADLELKLRRFYILKADGKRWRPIGCPDYPSRVISRSLNDLIYVLWNDKFNDNQHGFRKYRGAASAIYQIIEKLKGNPEIVYEFDLKSFFNTVRPMWVYRALLARSPLLAEMIYKIIMKINYKLPNERRMEVKIEFADKYVWMILLQPVWLIMLVTTFQTIGVVMWILSVMVILEIGFHLKEKGTEQLDPRHMSYVKTWQSMKRGEFNVIKPERELRTKKIGVGQIHTEKMEVMTKEGPIEMDVPYIIREGLPQGLSVSPVLATLTMELFKCPKELVLYADDGVFIGNDWKKFLKWKQDMSMIGAEIAEEKSGKVSKEFKFLGTTIDIEGEQIIYKEKVISWWDPNLERKLITLYVEEPYKKNDKRWNWKVKPNSWTAETYTDFIDLWNFPIWDWVLIWYKSIMYGLPHKGYRMFYNNVIIDILGASSFAVNELVKSKAELNLVAIKPLCPVFKGKLSNFCLSKSSYYEEIYENSLRHYIRKELPEYKNVMENYWDL